VRIPVARAERLRGAVAPVRGHLAACAYSAGRLKICVVVIGTPAV